MSCLPDQAIVELPGGNLCTIDGKNAIVSWPVNETVYSHLPRMKQIGATMGKMGLITVPVDKLALIYKLLHIRQNGRLSFPDSAEKRDPQKAYYHELHPTEIFLLLVLIGKEYLLFPSYDKSKVAQYCQEKDVIDSILHAYLDRPSYLTHVNKYLDEVGSLSSFVGQITPTLNSAIVEYLQLRTVKEGLQRGDIIAVPSNAWLSGSQPVSRKMFLYDEVRGVGTLVEPCHNGFRYLPPRQFSVPNEFPLGYWQGTGYQTINGVYINASQLRIDSVDMDAKDTEVGGETGMLGAAAIKASSEGKEFTFVLRYEKVAIDDNKVAAQPSEAEVRNWFLTRDDVISTDNQTAFMGDFHRKELERDLLPLKEEHKERISILHSCLWLLPELWTIVEDYAMAYYS